MGSCLSALCCSKLKGSLDDIPIALPEGVIQIKREDRIKRDLAVALVARSFAGTEMTPPEGSIDWILGPKLKEQWEDPRRLTLMEWFSKMFDRMTHNMGGRFMLAAQLEGGDLGAVVYVIHYPNGFKGMTCRLACNISRIILCDIGLPASKQLGDGKAGFMKRMGATNVARDMHKKWMSHPHVCLMVTAVEPSVQGRGLCSKLLRQVNIYADSLNLPIWLETSGGRNVAMYSRFGYEVVEKFPLRVEGDPDNFPPRDEFAMLRPARRQQCRG